MLRGKMNLRVTESINVMHDKGPAEDPDDVGDLVKTPLYLTHLFAYINLAHHQACSIVLHMCLHLSAI